MISRRGIISGMASLLAAPAIVKVSSLMPVKALAVTPTVPAGWAELRNYTFTFRYRVIELTDQDRAEMQAAQLASIAQAA